MLAESRGSQMAVPRGPTERRCARQPRRHRAGRPPERLGRALGSVERCAVLLFGRRRALPCVRHAPSSLGPASRLASPAPGRVARELLTARVEASPLLLAAGRADHAGRRAVPRTPRRRIARREAGTARHTRPRRCCDAIRPLGCVRCTTGPVHPAAQADSSWRGQRNSVGMHRRRLEIRKHLRL